MILNRHEITKLAILKELIDAQAPVSKDEIIQKLNISLSTLKRDIQHLNNDIHSMPEFQSIQILAKNGECYLVDPTPFSPYYLIKKITLNYHKDSIQYQFIKKIFFYPSMPIKELANSLIISQPYIYKLLARTNQSIAPFQIKIEFSKNKNAIYTTGNQQTMRLFKMYFFWNVNQGIEWPFSNLSIEQLYSFFPAKELEFLFKASQNKQQKFLYSLVVAHHFFSKKSGQLTLDKDFLETISVFQQVFDLSKSLERLLLYSFDSSTDQKSIALEKAFFNFSARVFCPYTDTEEAQIEIGKKLCKMENKLILYCKQLIQLFFKKFPELELNAEYPTIAYQMVYYWSLFFANIFYVHFDSSYLSNFMPISPDIEIQETPLFEKAKVFFHEFLAENPPLGSVVLSDFHLKLGYGLIYYFLSNLESRPLPLYVQFSKNMFGEAYIKAKLFKMFGHENIVFSDNIHTSSLIISNYFEDRYKNSKYFYLDNLEDAEMWSRLYRQIHQLQMLDIV